MAKTFADSDNMLPDASESTKSSAGALIPQPEPHELAPYNPYGYSSFMPGVADAGPSGMSLNKLWHAFRRRWLLASFVGLIFAVPAFLAVWFTMPESYEVSALLLCHYDVDGVTGRGGMNVDHVRQQAFREKQMTLLRNDMVLGLAKGYTDKDIPEPITKLPMLAEQSNMNAFLQKAITVKSNSSSDLIEVRMSGEDPRQMVQILKALFGAYLKYQNDDEMKSVKQSLSNLDSQIKGEQGKLTNLIEVIRSMEEVAGSSNNSVNLRTIELLQSDIRQLEVMLMDQVRLRNSILERIDTQKYLIDHPEAEQFPPGLVEMEMMKSVPKYKDLVDRASNLQDRILDLQGRLRNPNSPQITSLQANIDLTKKETKKIYDENVAMINKMLAGTSQGRNYETLPIMERSLARINGEIGRMNEDLKQKRAEYTKKSVTTADLEIKRAEKMQIENSISQLSFNSHNAETKLKGLNTQATVVLLTPPEIPQRANMTYRIALSSFTAMLCMLLGIGTVTLLENTKSRVNTVQELSNPAAGLRVLGTIPNLARLANKRSSDGGDAASSVLAESIDSVRTMLLQGRNRDQQRIVLVSSADEGEGKTTVATHLAASLARAGRRTLLIDGDLRKPSIHLLFGLPQGAGLSEVLRNEVELEAVIQPAHVEGLYLMQAGQCDHLCLAALAKEHAEAIFRTLRADFDYVVIDSGPVLGFADAMLLGGYADTAILSVLRDISRLPKVYEARERLESVGIPVLGSVVGRAPGVHHRAKAG